MTDNKPVRLTAGLAKKVDGFFNVNRSKPTGTPPRPDEPGPRRATINDPIGQGEVGSAVMLGLNTVVQVFNQGPTVQGDAPIYWSAGTEVSTFNGDDPVRRGQWEVFVPPEPTTGAEPSPPVGDPTEIDCDCNRLVIGQELDCDVCTCGNVYRYTYFPEINLPPASPEDPPVVWDDSGGLKRWRHEGDCLWATEKFDHPTEGCTDEYRYELQLTAGTPPTGTLSLVRTDGTSCDEIVATWCLVVETGCGFECFGVWKFRRDRPWSNLVPSSLACQLCVSPKFPKRRNSTASTSACACDATIYRPVRVVGPKATEAQMEAHGFEDVELFTKWLGWDILWELKHPTNYEIIDGPTTRVGNPGVCNPNHVQDRGFDGEVGVPAKVTWAASLQVTAGTVEAVDGVTLTVLFTVHVNTETPFWTRSYEIDLTCTAYAEALEAGRIEIPHVQDADGSGTMEGPLTSPITVIFDGTYPSQEEPTSSDACGPPDACADQQCWLEVAESAGSGKYWKRSDDSTCTTDCENYCDPGCNDFVNAECGTAGDFDVGYKCLAGACAAAPAEGDGVIITIAAAPGASCVCGVMSRQLCLDNGTGRYESTIDLCGVSYLIEYYEDGGLWYFSIGGATDSNADPAGPFLTSFMEDDPLCEGTSVTVAPA